LCGEESEIIRVKMLQKIRASTQMYPELYQKWFKLSLNPTEMVLIEILMRIIGLLSKATLGQLANNLPLPTCY
jgi:hypothetical protein